MRGLKVCLIFVSIFAFINANSSPKCPCNDGLTRVLDIIDRNTKLLNKAIAAYAPYSNYKYFIDFLEGYKQNLNRILEKPFGLPGSKLASEQFKNYIKALIQAVDTCVNGLKYGQNPLTTISAYFNAVKAACAAEFNVQYPPPAPGPNASAVELLDAVSSDYWSAKLKEIDVILNNLPNSIDDTLLQFFKSYKDSYEKLLKSTQKICEIVCSPPKY